MAHTYIVTVNTATGNGNAHLEGTVDGVAVSLDYILAAVLGMPLAQAKTYVAGLMLAQAFPAATQLPTGTFVQ